MIAQSYNLGPLSRGYRIALRLFFVAVFSSCELMDSGRRPLPDALLREIALSAIAKMNRKEFLEAANLLHYPPGYSITERETDSKNVAGSLGLMVQEFGMIETPKLTTRQTSFLNLGISGGDVPYWKSLADAEGVKMKEIFYGVHFSNLGQGLIRFTFIQLGTWQIRSIDFCLETSRADAPDVIGRIGKKIYDKMRARENRDYPRPQNKGYAFPNTASL